MVMTSTITVNVHWFGAIWWENNRENSMYLYTLVEFQISFLIIFLFWHFVSKDQNKKGNK